MSRDKLLAEWFWIERWDGSPAAALPLIARGLYREMLTRSWRLGGWLPNDHDAIRRLVRVTASEWKRAWPLVAPYWREDGEKLVNDTQLEVMAEARRRRAAASEHGKNAARARYRAVAGHGVEQDLGSARAVPEHQPPSPSPTDSLPASPPPPPSTAAGRPGALDGVEAKAGRPGEAEAARSDLYAALQYAVRETGQPRDELLTKASRTGNGAVMVNPEGVTSVPWLRATAERLAHMAARAIEARSTSRAPSSRAALGSDYPEPGAGPRPDDRDAWTAAAEANRRRTLAAVGPVEEPTCEVIHKALAGMRSRSGKPRVCHVCQAEIRPERVSA